MRASPLPVDEASPSGSVVAAQAAPLISGAPEILAAGVVAFIVILILILVLLGRWRAGRRAHDALRNKEFFQPAGEGAEITFDETEVRERNASVEPVAEEIFAEPPPKKRRSPFGGLFARRDKAPAEESFIEPTVMVDHGDPDQGLASVRIERPAPSAFGERRVVDFATIAREADRASAEREEEAARVEEAGRRRAEADAARAAADEVRRHAAEAEEHRHRLLAEDDARRRAIEGDRLRTPAPPAHAFEERRAPRDDIARTLAEVEEALHAQREAIQSETRSLLDSFARRFSDRLDALAQSMERREPQRFADPASTIPARSADLAGVAEEIARRLDEHHGRLIAAVSKRLDAGSAPSREFTALRDEIAALRRSLGSRAEPSAPTVQLTDLVRDALPPNAYELNAAIANNRRADCLIRLPHPPGPIAIDARFPVEAFHALHQERPNAENEFRRTALRHVVDIAERLIAPGVTADSAMMFVPSESMYAELHARFPEVVQDSYRAHVWIVSPTTLMATLHTLSAILKDAAPRGTAFAAQNDAQRALAEVEMLWARVAALEKGAGPVRTDVADAAPSIEDNDWNGQNEPDAGPQAAERAFRRLQTAANQDSSRTHGDLYADDRPPEADEADVEAERRRSARPPFPLR